MFAYNARLAFKSLNDKPSLTVLMVAAIAVGLGLFMTMLTLGHQAGKIPIPHISQQIHLVQLDNRELTADDAENFIDMVDLTYQDSNNLFSLISVGDQINVTCDSNFEVLGKNRITCLTTQGLDAQMAKCKAKHCTSRRV